MKKTALFVLLGVLVMACTSNVNQEQIDKIDSLIVTLEHSQKRMDSLNFQEIAEKKEKIEEHIDFIHNNYHDTLSKYLANNLSEYKMTEEEIKKIVLDNREKVEMELDKSIEQLENLKADIQNNLLEEEQAKAYYADEEEAAKKMNQATDKIVKSYQRSERRFKIFYPVADSLITQLNRKGIR
ncbi:hypothetical protein [Salibacter halophilus]|uniref:OmpH family outer membrane protein n=1 Tax=Salibacter halophilus TaxID=1803916 RepID=A0A6N6M549_9FLAO|nr:hypothetical protein [Salibacter halophilus]KAB1063361.1 hypothetical protein F3059_09840 [Salibacter halophilus]